jgi:glycosyltransferase involved in cell wall biosynthesis
MLTVAPPARVDLHLHSYASNVTDYYTANIFSIPESYSDPIENYHLLRRRGMSLVTLTDHNSIDGVRVLLDAGLPDVFISSEITTAFPEDGCHVHVTVANVTEAQFAEVLRLRHNIYEMVSFLDAEIAQEPTRPNTNRLAYFMTHPLMSTQNRPYGRDGALKVEHLERMMLLCDTFEVQNGARTRALNELTAQMIGALTPAMISRLAEKHRIFPKGETPWLKGVVGGSDDHAGINPGTTWTEFHAETITPNALIDEIRARRTRPNGAHGGPITLAHSLLKLLYDGSERRRAQGSDHALGLTGPLQALLRLVFASSSESAVSRLRFRLRWWLQGLRARLAPSLPGRSFEQMLNCEVYALLGDEAFRARLAALESTDARIFLVLGTLINRLLAAYLKNLQSVGPDNLVQSIKEGVAMVASNLFVSLPYLLSFLQQSSDCLIARDVRKTFSLEEPERLVLLTDTFFEINGVSGTIKRMIRESARRGLSLTVGICLSEAEEARHLQDPEVRAWISQGRLKILRSVATMDLPRYNDLKVQVPPFLELLDWLQTSGFTKMQISTPGLIGLAGLAAAKLLQIETASTYHTSVPEYVENYTRDVSLEALAWRYMITFYHAVDEVIVPSKFVASLLHKRGLRNRKLLILDRWVDVDRFHPNKRRADYWSARGVTRAEERVKFIYVGRVGVEKNLQLIAEAFRRLHAERDELHLCVVGDGPFRGELEAIVAGLPVTFTGFLEGEELAVALASADVKLFPSTTDTWGNAPLEAQASGLPVIVSNIGGPCELMEDGVTGLVVSGLEVEGLVAAMRALLDPALRRQMGANARGFVERHRVTEPFTAILDARAYRGSLREGAHPSRAMLAFPPPAEERAHVTVLGVA